MSQPKIIIPANFKPHPSSEEISVAYILMNYFNCNIEFVERNNNKTPDYKIKNQYWELKSPRGDGKRTIDNILRSATKQSSNIILNLQLCRMDQRRAINKVKQYLKINHNGINRLLIITKTKLVLDIK